VPTGRSRRVPPAPRGRPARPDRLDPVAHSRPEADRLPGWVAEEIRTTARPGASDRARRAFEQALAAIDRGDVAAGIEKAQEAKALAPRSGAVREVLGIALYRAERFRQALRELQAYRRMTGRVDQNHLIADSFRALGSPEKAVDAAMEALRAQIPDEARVESAVVGASALADLGRFTQALAVLRSIPTDEQLARPFHLRLWYVAGDVLDRAGRPQEAAAEFRKITRHDPGAFDAADRLARLEEAPGGGR